MIKKILKNLLFILALVVVSPMVLLTYLGILLLNKEGIGRIFCGCAEILSLCPTYIGVYLRKAYYWSTCDNVAPHTHFLFGCMLTHRENSIGQGVVIGQGTYIGYADIADNVQLGPRVSIISGKYQHGRPGERIQNIDLEPEHTVIHIGNNSWIGQNAIIMANIGKNCTVGAGSVVMRDVADNTTVLGNPARKVNLG